MKGTRIPHWGFPAVTMLVLFAPLEADPVESAPTPALRETRGAVAITTEYDAKEKSYITKGTVTPRVPRISLSRVVADTAAYHQWALRDINRGFEHRGFLVLVRDLKSPQGKVPPVLSTIYDLNLPWPLNLKGLSLDLVETARETSPDGNLSKLQFAMRKPSVALNRFGLTFRISENQAGEGVVDFQFSMQLSRAVNSFFSREKYVRNVEVRLEQAMVNLSERARSLAIPAPEGTHVP